MVALLGFMWFRRKKKSPMIKDAEDKEEKGVPSNKKNNNVDGKSSKASKKKNSVNFSLEDNIMISPVSTVMAAAPPNNSKTLKSQESSTVPRGHNNVDIAAEQSDSHVAQQQSTSSAPKCDEKVSQAPVLQQHCDSSSKYVSVKSAQLSSTSNVPQMNSIHSQMAGEQEHVTEKLSSSDEAVFKISYVDSTGVSLKVSNSDASTIVKSNKQDEKLEMRGDITSVKEETKAAVEHAEITQRVMDDIVQPEEVQQVASSSDHASEVQEKVARCETSVANRSKREDNMKEAQDATVSSDEKIDGTSNGTAEQESLSNGCFHADPNDGVNVICDVNGVNKKFDAVSKAEYESAQESELDTEEKVNDAVDGVEDSVEDAEDSQKSPHHSESSQSSFDSVKPLEPHTNGIDHMDHQNGLHSDSHSEVSSDSGKGNSVGETPQTTSPTVDVQEYAMYEFDFPSNLCGRLIGRMGKNINSIKDKTGADIFLKRKPYVKHYQICCIQGTNSQVNAALALIKSRFPPEYFEDITYEQLNTTVDQPPVLTPEIMQLSLPEGVSVDVIVSSVVDVSHVFVQQPTHPTFSCLERLNLCMNACYSQDGIVPQLPRPIEVGVICAAPIYNGWYRAQVVESHADSDEYDIKFVDYGGYVRVQGCQLRQIRSDFTTLPFQAVECYISNIVPPEGQEAFPAEASPILENLVQGKILQAQIMAHEEDGVPYIQLYELQGDQAVFVNREIVNQNVAQWMEFSS